MFTYFFAFHSVPWGGGSRRTKGASRTRFFYGFFAPLRRGLGFYDVPSAPQGRGFWFFRFFCPSRTRLFSVFLRYRGVGFSSQREVHNVSSAHLRRGFFAPQGRGFGFYDVPRVPLGRGFFRFFCASWTSFFFLFLCVSWVHDVPITPLGRGFFRFFCTSGTRFGVSLRTKCASRTRFI